MKKQVLANKDASLFLCCFVVVVVAVVIVVVVIAVIVDVVVLVVIPRCVYLALFTNVAHELSERFLRVSHLPR